MQPGVYDYKTKELLVPWTVIEDKLADNNKLSFNDISRIFGFPEKLSIVFKNDLSVYNSRFFDGNEQIIEIDLRQMRSYASFSLQHCKNLEVVNWQGILEWIEPYVLYGCKNIKMVTIEENSTFTIVDNVMYTKDLKSLVHVFKNDFKILDSVVEISKGAFFNLDIETLCIPYGVKKVCDCFPDTLKTIFLPDTVNDIHNAFKLSKVETIFCSDKIARDFAFDFPHKLNVNVKEPTLDNLLNLEKPMTEINKILQEANKYDETFLSSNER